MRLVSTRFFPYLSILIFIACSSSGASDKEARDERAVGFQPSESRNVEKEGGTHLRYTIKKSEIKELIKTALAVKADDESGFLKKQAK